MLPAMYFYFSLINIENDIICLYKSFKFSISNLSEALILKL